MCKIMIICGIPENKGKLAAKFIRKSLPFMTKNDQDGLGYVAHGDNGMFGERWLNVETAFKSRSRYTKSQKAINNFFGSAVSGSFENYTKFGTGTLDKAKSILFHTRYATCDKNMTNTHPFVIEDTALIHNGVVLNECDIMSFHEDSKISTCDSEAILQEYIANNINEEPNNIQDIADMVDGWYACGVLTKDKNKNPVVDIFKCEQSSLYVGIVPELESFVFCTEIGILQQTAEAAGMSVSAYDRIVGGKLIRMDANTGDRLELIEFKAEPDKNMLSSIGGKKKYSSSSKWDDDRSEWDYVTERWPAA